MNNIIIFFSESIDLASPSIQSYELDAHQLTVENDSLASSSKSLFFEQLTAVATQPVVQLVETIESVESVENSSDIDSIGIFNSMSTLVETSAKVR